MGELAALIAAVLLFAGAKKSREGRRTYPRMERARDLGDPALELRRRLERARDLGDPALELRRRSVATSNGAAQSGRANALHEPQEPRIVVGPDQGGGYDDLAMRAARIAAERFEKSGRQRSKPRVAPKASPVVGVPKDPVAERLARSLAKDVAVRKYGYNRNLAKAFQKQAGLVIDGLYGGGTAGAVHFFLGKAPRALFKPTALKRYSPVNR